MSTNDELVQKKINEFAQILQNFGLNLIQSIGQMKHTLGILTEKVEKIEKELIELKEVRAQFQEFGKFKGDVFEEFFKLNALVKDINGKIGPKPISGAITEPSQLKHNTPLSLLEDIEIKIKDIRSIHELRDLVKDAKEELFVLTGGHRVLFEFREIERKIKPNMDLDKDGLRQDLLKKIDEWKRQF